MVSLCTHSVCFKFNTCFRVTICAAAICSYAHTNKFVSVRYALIALWSVSFLVYVIFFAMRLQSWDDSLDGHCYSSQGLASPEAEYPKVDNVYVSITTLYFFLSWSFFATVTMSKSGRKGNTVAESIVVLLLSSLQLPLHAYSIITLRASNEKLLKSGSVEQQWGFGQIAAMLLLGGNLLVLLNGCQGELPTKTSLLDPSLISRRLYKVESRTKER